MDKLPPDTLVKMMETMQIQGEAIKKLAEKMEMSMKTPSNDRTTTLTHTMSLLGQFNYDPDHDYTFNEWYGQNESILTENCTDDSERRKIILKALGKEEYVQLKGRTSPNTPESMEYKELLRTLKEIFGPTKSLFRRRHETLSLTLPPGKTADEALNEANIRGDKFEFTELDLNQFKIFLTLQFLKDPSYKSLRSMILKAVDQKPDIAIDELRKVLKSFETRMDDVNLGNSLDPRASYEVNELKKYHRQPKYPPHPKSFTHSRTKQNSFKQNPSKPTGTYTCYKCDGPHLTKSCQKTNLSCSYCKKKGHNEAACLKKKASKFNNITINNVSSDDSRDYVTLGVNSRPMKFRIDSGADMSIIGPETWKVLKRPPITPFNSLCSSVDGTPLSVKGSFKATLTYDGNSYTDNILVLAKKATSLLCGKASKELGIITLHNKGKANINIVETYAQTMATQYTELFKEELGKCTKLNVHLQVKPEATPVHKNARPVAIAVQDSVNAELDRLLENGTLKKVDSSEWASPIVVAKKSGGNIRVCADYSTGLNDALTDIEHPLPNMEEVLSKFSGNKVFTQLDLSDAYLQIPLDEESQKLATINTLRGLFQYTRLVFGLKPAPAIFQRTLEQALAGIPGILIYLDDILVMAPDRQLHDDRLHQVLARLETWGFRLRLNKCHFNVPEVTYLGMKITHSGIQADPTRVSADSKNLIAYLRVLFRHYGDPETIVSDNGGQFISEEFAKFCQDLQIVHLKSAPRMPQSNGLAERSVQTLKKSLEPSQSSLDSAVLTYNYTPNEALDGKTPNEIFFGRQLRTPFDIFKPNSPHFPNMNKSDDFTPLNRTQKIMKEQFDTHHGTRTRLFTKGEMVTIQLVTGKRVTGKLIQLIGHSMAKIQVQDQVHTRHLNQIWKRIPNGYDENVDELDIIPLSSSSTPSTSHSIPIQSKGPGTPPNRCPPVARRVQPERNAKKPVDYTRQLSSRRSKR